MSNVSAQTFLTKHRKFTLQSSPHQKRTAWASRTAQTTQQTKSSADLVSGKVPGVLILDPEKVGEVAVRVAQQVAPIRKKMKNLPSLDEIKQIAKTCRQCNMCRRSCPQDLKIPQALKAAGRRQYRSTNRPVRVLCRMRTMRRSLPRKTHDTQLHSKSWREIHA